MNYEEKYKNLVQEITKEYIRLKKNLHTLPEYQVGCMLQIRIILEKLEEPVPEVIPKKLHQLI